MMFYIKLLSIVIAVSLDGFGVGITYGMRKIHLPLIGFFIVVTCSGLIVFLSMTIGHMIKAIIPPTLTDNLGSLILIGLGCFVLFSILRQKHAHTDASTVTKERSHKFQRFTQILKDPTKADNDASGTISMSEATVLGIALALDAFAAGFGASMLGYTPIITAIFIALMSGIFLYIGVNLGRVLAHNTAVSKLPFLPPIILIAIGVYHLL